MKPIKLRMLTIDEGEEIEIIFDDESLEDISDLEITQNHFGNFLKLNIKKKAPAKDAE
ncbi:MAG: hypothetical protein KAG18_02040 [Sinobacterium sp.]|nr:hypothetical protein [Sinobacterium sp.]